MFVHVKLASCGDRNSSCRSVLSVLSGSRHRGIGPLRRPMLALAMDKLLSSFQLLKAQRKTLAVSRCMLCAQLRASGLGPHLSEPTAATLASESSGPGARLAP